MSKNIINIMLENKELPETIVSMIMKCHGGVDAMVPDKISKNVKACIRKGNFKFISEEGGGRGGVWIDKYLEIQIDKNNIKSVIDNKVKVHYKYPTKYGYMTDCKIVNDFKGDFIWFDKYKLNLDKFEYLKIRVGYDHITIREIDD